MKTLRRVVGTAKNFQYVVEDILLESLGKATPLNRMIPSNSTSIRIGKGILFQYSKDGKVFNDVTEDRYFNILNNHKTNSVVRRKKVVKEPTNVNYKLPEESVLDQEPTATLNDIFKLSDHFVERMSERFINNTDGAAVVMDYIFNNGVVIDPVLVMKYRDDVTLEGKVIIYEPDLNAVVVAKPLKNQLLLITTYPKGYGWFERLWKDHKKGEHVGLKDYAKRTFL
jgi:hypothetical protein